MKNRILITVIASVALSSTPALAQCVRGPVAFAASDRAVAASVQAMPKVAVNGAVTASAAARINAALQREDGRARAAAADCRASSREMQGKDAGDAWTRSVTVTMAGPRYLAYQVSDSYYCGGPYPNDGLRSDFVYDLTSGSPVNWLRLFPAGAKGKASTSAVGASLGVVVWAGLAKRAAAQAEPECRDVFEDGSDPAFTIGLDARSATLTAMPADFAHVIQACAAPIRLGIADLRRLGFSADLVAALAAAQQEQRARSGK